MGQLFVSIVVVVVFVWGFYSMKCNFKDIVYSTVEVKCLKSFHQREAVVISVVEGSITG